MKNYGLDALLLYKLEFGDMIVPASFIVSEFCICVAPKSFTCLAGLIWDIPPAVQVSGLDCGRRSANCDFCNGFVSEG